MDREAWKTAVYGVVKELEMTYQLNDPKCHQLSFVGVTIKLTGDKSSIIVRIFLNKLSMSLQ